jgi:hypothetical protein
VHSVQTVAAIRAQLWDAGYRPVPVYNHDDPGPSPGKRPWGDQWQNSARREPPVAAVAAPLPGVLNTGILCDGLRPIDFDIDDPTIASRCRAIALSMFGEAPIRMRRDSPRCLVLYRAAEGMPRKRTLAGTLGKIEVLGYGNQFVAFGTHPDGAELEWFPDAPGQELLDNLPVITEANLDTFFDTCAPIINAEIKRTNGHDHHSSEPQADLLRVATALAQIPNNGPADWDAWNRVGMALWRATGGSAAGFALFDSWSQQHPAYDPIEVRNRWDHYPSSPPSQIGAGTLFFMAKEAEKKKEAPGAGTHRDRTRDTSGQESDSGAELPLVYFEDIKPNLDAADFVENLLILATMAVVYGESNCGKTFWMLDLCLHVAWGRVWRGREVETGGVIYCALEGSHGISNRVSAFRKHYQLEDVRLPFAIVPYTLNMLGPDTDKLISAINDAREQMGCNVVLVVIDTLSRALAGGNENAPDDMGALVVSTDKVRQATGACVVYIHHSGKDAAKGARGHSLLRAATDTEIEVARDDPHGPSIARVTKQRDLEIEGEFWFRLEPVNLGVNRRGKDVFSCVVVEQKESEARTEPDNAINKGLPPGAVLALRALHIAMSKGGAILPPASEYPANTVAVSASLWRDEFYQLKSGSQDVKKHAFSRAEDILLARKVVTQRNTLVWLVRRNETGH